MKSVSYYKLRDPVTCPVGTRVMLSKGRCATTGLRYQIWHLRKTDDFDHDFDSAEYIYFLPKGLASKHKLETTAQRVADAYYVVAQTDHKFLVRHHEGRRVLSALVRDYEPHLHGEYQYDITRDVVHVLKRLNTTKPVVERKVWLHAAMAACSTLWYDGDERNVVSFAIKGKAGARVLANNPDVYLRLKIDLPKQGGGRQAKAVTVKNHKIALDMKADTFMVHGHPFLTKPFHFTM